MRVDQEPLRDAEGSKPETPVDSSEDIKASEPEDAPEGGSRAWLVAAGACCISFSSLGYANSIGVLIEYYLQHQLEGQSPDDVAWIGSISAFLQFAVAALAGPLFDRYGGWVWLPSCKVERS